MTVLRSINGRYNSDYKFIINFLLRFSSTGIYRNELSMLNLIKSESEQMKKAFNAAKQVNSELILNKTNNAILPVIKERIVPAYGNAVDLTSLFCNRFFDIRENGGSFGKELIPTNVFKSISDIQNDGLILKLAATNLKEARHIEAELKINDFRIDVIINKSNTITESAEQNYNKMLEEFKNRMALLHDSLSTRQNMHCM
jgi:hypothetical protein